MSLVDSINKQFGSQPDYVAYNVADTIVSIGLPPIAIVGLDSIRASYIAPQVQRFPSLTGGGAFASAKGRAGNIQLSLLSTSISSGLLQLLELTGVEFPIYSADVSSAGTSFIFADACRIIQTPDWGRSAKVGTTTYSFSTNRLIISHGVRLSEDD